jgi:hypothetical protein
MRIATKADHKSVPVCLDIETGNNQKGPGKNGRFFEIVCCFVGSKKIAKKAPHQNKLE